MVRLDCLTNNHQVFVVVVVAMFLPHEGDPKQRCMLASKRSKCANISIRRLCAVVPVQPCWLTLLPMTSRKKLAHSVINASAGHADLVHDVTDTNAGQKNGGGGHGHFFTTLKYLSFSF